MSISDKYQRQAIRIGLRGRIRPMSYSSHQQPHFPHQPARSPAPGTGPQPGNYPYQGQPFQGQPVHPQLPTNGMATFSMVIGICSTLMSFVLLFLTFVLAFIPMPLSIVGVVVGIVGLRQIRSRGNESGSGLAWAGIAVNAIAFALQALFLLLAIMLFGFLAWFITTDPFCENSDDPSCLSPTPTTTQP